MFCGTVANCADRWENMMLEVWALAVSERIFLTVTCHSFTSKPKYVANCVTDTVCISDCWLVSQSTVDKDSCAFSAAIMIITIHINNQGFALALVFRPHAQ